MSAYAGTKLALLPGHRGEQPAVCAGTHAGAHELERPECNKVHPEACCDSMVKAFERFIQLTMCCTRTHTCCHGIGTAAMVSAPLTQVQSLKWNRDLSLQAGRCRQYF